MQFSAFLSNELRQSTIAQRSAITLTTNAQRKKIELYNAIHAHSSPRKFAFRFKLRTTAKRLLFLFQ